jgi:hypothetical protein
MAARRGAGMHLGEQWCTQECSGIEIFGAVQAWYCTSVRPSMPWIHSPQHRKGMDTFQEVNNKMPASILVKKDQIVGFELDPQTKM